VRDPERLSYWDAGYGIEVIVDSAGFWAEMQYVVSWPMRGLLMTELLNLEPDPLIAPFLYKLLVETTRGISRQREGCCPLPDNGMCYIPKAFSLNS
jgi:hypothetical protein